MVVLLSTARAEGGCVSVKEVYNCVFVCFNWGLPKSAKMDKWVFVNLENSRYVGSDFSKKALPSK